MNNPYTQFENNMLMGGGTGQQRQWQGQNREKRTPWQGQRSATPWQAPVMQRQPPPQQPYALVGQARPAPTSPTAWQGQQWQQPGQPAWQFPSQPPGQGQQGSQQGGVNPWMPQGQLGPWKGVNPGSVGNFNMAQAQDDYESGYKSFNRPGYIARPDR